MAKKSLRTRKGLALGLAVIGIAGLSLASAAQLNLTTSGSIQAGSVLIKADCQTSATPIAVTFAAPTYVAGNGTTILSKYAPTNVVLSLIDAACATTSSKYKVALVDKDGAQIGADTSGTVTTTSITVSLSSVNANLIAGVALTIYS